MTEILYNDINQLNDLHLKYIYNYEVGNEVFPINALVNIITNNEMEVSIDQILPNQLSNHIYFMESCTWLKNEHELVFNSLYHLADIFQIVTPLYETYNINLDNTVPIPIMKDTTINQCPISRIPADWNYDIFAEINDDTNDNSMAFEQYKKTIQKSIILGLCNFCLFVNNKDNVRYFDTAKYWLKHIADVELEYKIDHKKDGYLQARNHRNNFKFQSPTIVQMQDIAKLARENVGASITDKKIIDECINKYREKENQVTRSWKISKLIVNYYRHIEKILKKI